MGKYGYRENARAQGHFLSIPPIRTHCIIEESDLEDDTDLEDNYECPRYRTWDTP
jgi:hypothetical protein